MCIRENHSKIRKDSSPTMIVFIKSSFFKLRVFKTGINGSQGNCVMMIHAATRIRYQNEFSLFLAMKARGLLCEEGAATREYYYYCWQNGGSMVCSNYFEGDTWAAPRRLRLTWSTPCPLQLCHRNAKPKAPFQEYIPSTAIQSTSSWDVIPKKRDNYERLKSKHQTRHRLVCIYFT